MQPWWAEETFKNNLTDPKRLNYIAAENSNYYIFKMRYLIIIIKKVLNC